MRKFSAWFVCLVIIIVSRPVDAPAQTQLAEPETVDRNAVEFFIYFRSDQEQRERLNSYLTGLKKAHEEYLTSPDRPALLARELIITSPSGHSEEQAWLKRQHYALLLRSHVREFVASLIGPPADALNLILKADADLNPQSPTSPQQLADAYFRECWANNPRCQYINQAVKAVFGLDIKSIEKAGREQAEWIKTRLTKGSTKAADAASTPALGSSPSLPPNLTREEIQTLFDEAVTNTRTQTEMNDAIQAFRLVSWIAGQSKNYEFAKFADATANALSQFSKLQQAANMSNFATGVAAGLITANWISAIVSISQPDPQMKAFGAMAGMIQNLNKQMNQRFDRLEKMITQFHEDETKRLDAIAKQTFDIKVDTATIIDLLIQQSTIGFRISELSDSIANLAQKIESMEVRTRLLDLRTAAYALEVSDEKIRTDRYEELIVKLGAFALVIATQPPFSVSEQKDVREGLHRASQSGSLDDGFVEAARLLRFLAVSTGGGDTVYPNLIEFLRATSAFRDTVSKYRSLKPETTAAISAQLDSKQAELITLLTRMTSPPIAQKFFSERAALYRKHGNEVIATMRSRFSDFDRSKSGGVNFLSATNPTQEIIKSLSARYKSEKVPFCQYDEKTDPKNRSYDGIEKPNTAGHFDFPTSVFRHVDPRVLAAALFGVSDMSWCVMWLGGVIIGEDPTKALYQVIGRVGNDVVFLGGVVGPYDRRAGESIGQAMVRNWNASGRQAFDATLAPEHLLHDIVINYRKGALVKHSHPSHQAAVSQWLQEIDFYRENCYFVEDKKTYDDRKCLEKIEQYNFFVGTGAVKWRGGRPFVRSYREPQYEDQWNKVGGLITAVCRSRIAMTRDLVRDDGVIEHLAQLETAYGSLVAMGSIVFDSNPGVELFLTGGGQLFGLVTPKRIREFLERNTDDIRKLERGSLPGGICPADEFESLAAAIETGAEAIASRLYRRVTPWLAQQLRPGFDVH